MCGIAGIISKNNMLSLKESVFAMSQSIKHRGPDGEGFVFCNNEKTIPVFSNETPLVNQNSSNFLFNPRLNINDVSNEYKVAFAHRRLSIIDLTEAGHQPQCDISGSYWITFNGELFNYIELREELKLLGHQFITQTDTEVLIESYKEWGCECIKKFNGMFAFALYDKNKHQVFCARDRAGVKPFYYSNNPQEFSFASEYKAFIKSKLVAFSINETEQQQFLLHGEIETSQHSLFNGIVELKPFEYIVYNLSTHELNLNSYNSITETNYNHLSDKEIINIIEEKLLNSIKLRLRSDVEVGSCLSGGLDSSIIACAVKKIQPTHNLKLFTAIFPNEKFNESNYAQLVAKSVNGIWNTVNPKPEDFFKEIEALNYVQDLPIWSTSTYSQYKVMQLASEHHIKVLLDGQGADELFAGYEHHYLAYLNEDFSFKKLNQIKSYLPSITNLYFKESIKKKFNLKVDYSPFFKDSFSKTSFDTKYAGFASNLNNQLQLDYKGRLKSFLKCEDRCSMAFGIESRVPFSDDTDLVNLMFSIEGKRKIQNGISKYLLREATKSFIPDEIYTRKDKIGFEAPLLKWMLLYESNIKEVICEQLDFINKDYFIKNYTNHLLNKTSFIFRLYSFAIWKKVYLQA